MSKAKRQAGQKEAELAQENKSVIDALTAMMKSLGRDAPAAADILDGSSSAESFLRELERSPEFQNSSCDERSRMVVAALEGEPRRTLQSMDYLYEPYWRIKQVLEDLYPPPETPTHQEFYQLRCGPQGLQEYYLQKVRIGTQLNIDRKEMVNALTQGMPSYSRNLLLIATPSSPSEWLTLARRIYGIGRDPSRPGISSPTGSPSPRQSGAINVYNKFIPDYARIRNSLNQLLKKNVKWEWTSDCQKAFDKLKQLLSSGPILHLFKSDLPCQVYSDASLQGIGGVLKQLHPDGNSYPVQYYSRTLRKYERNYTITELECLAIIETVDRFKVYLAGNGFTIFTDHCALQWLKNIKNPTGRLFRWSLRLSVYDYQVKYIKGTKQLEADILSRNPFCGLLDATQLKMYQSELRDNSKYVHQTSGLTTVTRRGVRKIVVPPSLRPTILREAHQKFNHPGISQLNRIISAQYFWSGMSIDIRAFVKNCNICQMSKTPKGPKYGELGELPESPLPFDLVSMDTIAGFARYGSAKNYLHVVVDHATRFAWTFPSRSTSTTTYIQVIKKVLQSGCPKRLLTDRAPAFTSPRFRRFLISHNIQPMLTTSNHPQANGLSERLNATLTGKLRLLHLQHPRASWTMLQSKVVKAYNDTPHSVTGFPPSYLMDGSLPKELSQHLDPYPSVTESRRLALQRTKERHKIDKIRFDKNHRSPDFEVGDLVLTKIYQHPNTGKLVPYFSGPYEIIEVISPYIVRINRPNQAQNLETEIIHVNKLKHYSEDTKYIFTPHSMNNNSAPKSYFIYHHFPPEIFNDDYKNYASTLSNPFNHMNPDIFLDNDEQTLTARYISTPDTILNIAIRLKPSPTTKIILPSSPTRKHTPQISPQFSALLINCDNTKLENRPVIIKIKSIKYICKYVNKGNDMAIFGLSKENTNDEISQYLLGRYISSNESVWRILSFPIHERHPNVVHLSVHLENGQRVYFTNANARTVAAAPPNTTLTAFFQLCQQDPFAKNLLYSEVPRYYTWNASRKSFCRRKQGTSVPEHEGIFASEALGRVYTVHPNNAECFFLRMLLHTVRGPTSFSSLKYVNGEECRTFREACQNLGLLEDDQHLDNVLSEAASQSFPEQIRELFAILLTTCNPSNPQNLWEKYRESMSEDVLIKARRANPTLEINFSSHIFNEVLLLLQNKCLAINDKK
ncbi:hypothetical protein LAZ67_X002675 [Cordylochernes scorpioides]|uniref:RNA-directed DNA polymerase n=1 Tax=Cordylochernes scorpioides TaxID=51811 RepID=A0ABY6LW18_9ARAC|nr:hypothetical protein LAZ67_X002675 [Cordylochernes scorpioides]